MKQKDIEKRLNYLQETDRTSPEIYELLVELTSNMLKSQNWLLNPIDFDNVSHDVAAELYMKVADGTYTIKFWKAMAYRLIKFTYVKKQRKVSMTQVFDTERDPIRKEMIYQSCASCINDNEKDMIISENKAFLLDMRLIIEEVMNNSKFNPNSSEYLGLYTSVVLSLLHNEDKYFHVSDNLKPYVHILSQQVKSKIADSGMFNTDSQYDFMCSPEFDNALMPNLEFLGLLD
jgi:hypothetical protein